MLSWRAERMGWAAPAPEAPPTEPGDFRERLIDSPLSPVDLDLPLREEQ
jgi:hypothetical protein